MSRAHRINLNVAERTCLEFLHDGDVEGAKQNEDAGEASSRSMACQDSGMRQKDSAAARKLTEDEISRMSVSGWTKIPVRKLAEGEA